MFALTRMVIRAGVLAALIATIISVASAMSVDGELEVLEEAAVEAYEWLVELVARLTGSDTSVGDIRLGDLTSSQGWIDLGNGLFAGGDQPAEIESAVTDAATQAGQDAVDDLVGSFDLARIVDEVNAQAQSADN